MAKENVKISAVMDTKLAKILIQTGQYGDFISGEIKCANCGKIITPDNVSMLLPFNLNGEVKLKFYCDSMDCLNCDK